MKINVFSDWWSPDYIGGAERSSEEVYTKFKDLGYDVSIFTLKNRQRKSSKVRSNYVFYIPNLCIRRSPYSNNFIKALDKCRKYFDFITPMFAAHFLLRGQPDVVIIHQIERIGYRLVKYLKRGNKDLLIIRVFHDLSDTCLLRSRFKRGKNCKKTCNLCFFKQKRYLEVSKFYSYTVSNSHFTKNKLVDLGIKSETNLVGYPVMFLNETPTVSPNVRHGKGLAYVGRIHHTKGIEIVIDVAARLNRELYLVGRGSFNYVRKLQNSADRLGVKVHFLNHLSSPYVAIEKLVSIVIVPSIWEEPFGRIPLEAVSHGFKVVHSNVGGLPEAAKFISPEPPTFSATDLSSLHNAILKAERQESQFLNTSRLFELSLSSTVSLILDNVSESTANE